MLPELPSSQLGGRGSGGVHGSGGVRWSQIYSLWFYCQWQEGRRGLCLLWRGMWSPCLSLTWGCRGLPYALRGMQGKHSPEGFSFWVLHDLCWCFNIFSELWQGYTQNSGILQTIISVSLVWRRHPSCTCYEAAIVPSYMFEYNLEWPGSKWSPWMPW